MATSPSAISSPVFNGQSSFSSDFQTMLTRAVSVASLPLQALQSDVSTITTQQQALTSLESQFTGVQAALQQVASAMQGSFTAQSSEPSAVSASVTTGALAGTYSIEVDSAGSSTTTLSKANLIAVT